MAMLVYSEKLTRDPCACNEVDVAELKDRGFEDDEVLDIVQIVGYFAFVNRLACGLGIELESYWAGEA